METHRFYLLIILILICIILYQQFNNSHHSNLTQIVTVDKVSPQETFSNKTQKNIELFKKLGEVFVNNGENLCKNHCQNHMGPYSSRQRRESAHSSRSSSSRQNKQTVPTSKQTNISSPVCFSYSTVQADIGK